MKQLAYDWNIKVNKTHWWFRARNLIIKTVIKKILKNDGLNKILDMGCGSGANLKMLSEFGEVYAIEPEENIRKYAISENPSCKIYAGALPDNNPLRNEKFDLIVSLDVLEHIEDDKQTLVELKKMLTKDGKIVITVPAFQFLFGKSDIVAHHYRRYNKKLIKQLMQDGGFKNFKIFYFNTFLFLPIVLARLLEKYFPKNIEVNSSGKESFLNTFLFNLMSFERFLLKINPIGISLCGLIKNKE